VERNDHIGVPAGAALTLVAAVLDGSEGEIVAWTAA
jgi:hypothetical protein